MAVSKLRVISMFAGIGGFDLGLERTGHFETVAVAELDPYASKVLALRFPNAPNLGDVTTAEYPDADIICAGFPCQDISYAGAGAGLAGSRSGLFWEVVRAVRMVRPKLVLLENVAALLGRGLDTVVRALAEIGYDAEWHCIPAAAVGAPHRRDRIWIIAHPRGEQHEGGCAPFSGSITAKLADNDRQRTEHSELEQREAGLAASASGLVPGGRCAARVASQWSTEPNVGRVVARVSDGLDGGRLDGTPQDHGTAEVLCALRNGDGAEALQWTARGFGGLRAAEILFADVREYAGPPKALGDVSLASPPAPAVIMRSLWLNGKAACSSCRRAAGEQWAGEHSDTLRLLSQLLACDCRAAWMDPTGTSTAAKNRVDRLRCLGNAVVPQIPELIGRAILASLEGEGLAA